MRLPDTTAKEYKMVVKPITIEEQRQLFFYKFIYLFIYGCVGSSHCGGLSCCGARALGARASVAVAQRL